jgi:ribonuclease-3
MNFSFLKNFNNKTSKEEEDFLTSLKPIIGYKPKDVYYFKKAFTHSSVKKEKNGKPFNYERLEFLGDSLLDAVVSSFLYERTNKDEGYLTKMRSKIVSRENLNQIGKTLNLVDLVESNVKKKRYGDNIYGNLYEAVVGAVFLDKGYYGAEQFVQKTLLKNYVDLKQLEGKITSYKSVLIEFCQKNKLKFEFKVKEEQSKERIKHFTVTFLINKKTISKGRSTSKKKAEEIAAKRAYYSLQQKIEKNN